MTVSPSMRHVTRIDAAAENLASGFVLRFPSPCPPPQRSSYPCPRRAGKTPSACSRLGRRRLSGSGAILVSGADSLNPWERALKNRGAPAQGETRGGSSCGAGSNARGFPGEPLGITGRPEGGQLCPGACALELSRLLRRLCPLLTYRGLVHRQHVRFCI